MSNRYRRKSDVGDWAQLIESLHNMYTTVQKNKILGQLEEMKLAQQKEANREQRQHETYLVNLKAGHEDKKQKRDLILDKNNIQHLVHRADGSLDEEASFVNISKHRKYLSSGASYGQAGFLKPQSYYDMPYDPSANAFTDDDITMLSSYMQDVFLSPEDGYDGNNMEQNDQWLKQIGLLGDGETFVWSDDPQKLDNKVGIGASELRSRFDSYKQGLSINPRHMSAKEYSDFVQQDVKTETLIASLYQQTPEYKGLQPQIDQIPELLKSVSGYWDYVDDGEGNVIPKLNKDGTKWLEKNNKGDKNAPGQAIFALYTKSNVGAFLDRYIGTGELEDKFIKEVLQPLYKENKSLYEALNDAYTARKRQKSIEAETSLTVDNIMNENWRRKQTDYYVGGKRLLGKTLKELRSKMTGIVESGKSEQEIYGELAALKKEYSAISPETFDDMLKEFE